ncbi:outer membrane protein transport protein [Sabulilitoribacter multivorans]|uniref:Outer membrane protein transport protein n=1 Tax=Flaviramulus multivorans TaxID=1304750 RepID=A0ABS9ILW4_9FLAO|nr:outer membrane protein transport protein [Flaviramulus multivorans]MCF7561588.1 outer membrane protein transport protein [Flaviramulus multivorans]
MIKKLVLVFIAFIAIHSYGQEGTASPYSFYGIGSLKFKGTVENRSMGGLSIYTDSIHMNLRNPASYTGDNVATYPFNGESRPVKFTLGGTYSSTNLESDSSSDNASATTFDYLAISVPVGKFGFGLGLLPYTSVGYKLESINSDDEIENRFRGEGGLNKVFFGLGYQIAKGLSIGADLHYNFGNIQNSTIEYQYDDGFPVQYQARENNRSDLSGINLNFGISYKTLINDKLELVSGVTFTPESSLTSKNQRSFSTVSIGSNTGEEFEINTIDVDLESMGLSETDLILPSKLSFGAGIGKPMSWFIGAEYATIKTSNFSNVLYNSSTTTYEDGSTFSLGGFYIPQYNSFSSYFKRTVYRAGLHFENTGLNINNESIKEFGISFGLGLPVGNPSLLSNANLGFEIGKRGTKNSNLIQENFINFQLSLSLNDRWFQKRKYD